MCYTVTLVGAIAASAAWAKTKNMKLWWLNLMLYGGAVFGVVDHLYNGELFLVSENIVSDLLLGIAIVAAILLLWSAILIFSRVNPALTRSVNIKGA